MILSRTPLRLSLAGGGTDFPDYFRTAPAGGCVLSSAIDKYVYVAVKPRFDGRIRLSYSRTEVVDHVDELEHELAREALRLTGVSGGVEICTLADIPSEGSGLGSSSAVTVGLLNALHAYQGRSVSAHQLAREAVQIECEVLGAPIGWQDQFAAAFGGMGRILFEPDGCVRVRRLDLATEHLAPLAGWLMLFYTGITRSASTILAAQKAGIEERRAELDYLRGQVDAMRSAVETGAWCAVGGLLHAGWERKRSLAPGITTDRINWLYNLARGAGAIGGKIAGAGGGGFLMLCCPPDRQEGVRKALSGLQELSFAFEAGGSRIVYRETSGHYDK